jgi:pimeloyl-ACP methyl ester carboxylesterase
MVSELPGIETYVAQGAIVVATDYEGLGTPGVHPFLVGESEGRGVLDAARAARQFPGANASNRVAVYGYSQGGHAALFAGELAASYAPELDVVGVAAGAPIAELKTLLPLASNVPPLVGYPVMGVFGYEAAYPEVDPASVLTPSAVAEGRRLVESVCEEAVLKAFDRPTDQTIAAKPEATPPWPALLEANSAGRVRIPAPILLVQGEADTVVFPVFTDELAQRLCAAGDTVAVEKFAGAGHVAGEPASAASVATWIAARFANQPAPASCR